MTKLPIFASEASELKIPPPRLSNQNSVSEPARINFHHLQQCSITLLRMDRSLQYAVKSRELLPIVQLRAALVRIQPRVPRLDALRKQNIIFYTDGYMLRACVCRILYFIHMDMCLDVCAL